MLRNCFGLALLLAACGGRTALVDGDLLGDDGLHPGTGAGGAGGAGGTARGGGGSGDGKGGSAGSSGGAAGSGGADESDEPVWAMRGSNREQTFLSRYRGGTLSNLRWHFLIGGSAESNLTVQKDGSLVFVSSAFDKNSLLSVSAQGTLRWKHPIDQRLQYGDDSDNLALGGDDSIRYVDLGGVYGASPAGEMSWSVTLKAPGHLEVAKDGTTYVTGGDASGDVVLGISPSGSVMWKAPGGGTLIDAEGNVYLLRPALAQVDESGHPRWTASRGCAQAAYAGSDTVLCSSDTGITAYSTTGKELWHQGDLAYGAMASGGRLYAYSPKSELHILDLKGQTIESHGASALPYAVSSEGLLFGYAPYDFSARTPDGNPQHSFDATLGNQPVITCTSGLVIGGDDVAYGYCAGEIYAIE